MFYLRKLLPPQGLPPVGFGTTFLDIPAYRYPQTLTVQTPSDKPVNLAISSFNDPFPGLVDKPPLVVFLDSSQAVVKTSAMMAPFHFNNDFPGFVDIPGMDPFSGCPKQHKPNLRKTAQRRNIPGE